MSTITAPCSSSGGLASNGSLEDNVSERITMVEPVSQMLEIDFFQNPQISDSDLSVLPLHSFLWCNHQLFHPRPHVRLLRPGSLGASGAEIPLVEEIPHHYSDGGY